MNRLEPIPSSARRSVFLVLLLALALVPAGCQENAPPANKPSAQAAGQMAENSESSNSHDTCKPIGEIKACISADAHMGISWYRNTIENYMLQIYASEPKKLPEAFRILDKTLEDLSKCGIPERKSGMTKDEILPPPCKSHGWIRCSDGWCYPGKCPPSSGPGIQE